MHFFLTKPVETEMLYTILSKKKNSSSLLEAVEDLAGTGNIYYICMLFAFSFHSRRSISLCKRETYILLNDTYIWPKKMLSECILLEVVTLVN